MKKGEKRPDLWKARIGLCLICNSEFRAVKDFKDRKQKYCSKKCWSIRGNRHSLKCEGCSKIGLNKYGKKYCSRDCAQKHIKNEKHGQWKGDLAGYSARHKILGKPNQCFNCRGNTPRVEWANVSGEYLRNKNDFIPLCSGCHRKFDRSKSFDSMSLIIKYALFTGNNKIKLNGQEITWDIA